MYLCIEINLQLHKYIQHRFPKRHIPDKVKLSNPKMMFTITRQYLYMQQINKDLKNYIESQIIPMYNYFDAAHQVDHAQVVINQSLELAKQYGLNMNMVYTIAAYHDTGLSEGRRLHNLVSGQILRNDPTLRSFFSDNEIETMVQAVEDHRASCSHSPRSIYGLVVAEADRLIDGPNIFKRSIQYGLSHYPEYDKDEHFRRFMNHMKEKFAEGGYIRIWLPESRNAIQLKKFQQLLRDEKATKNLFNKTWDELMNESKAL